MGRKILVRLAVFGAAGCCFWGFRFWHEKGYPGIETLALPGGTGGSADVPIDELVLKQEQVVKNAQERLSALTEKRKTDLRAGVATDIHADLVAAKAASLQMIVELKAAEATVQMRRQLQQARKSGVDASLPASARARYEELLSAQETKLTDLENNFKSIRAKLDDLARAHTTWIVGYEKIRKISSEAEARKWRREEIEKGY